MTCLRKMSFLGQIFLKSNSTAILDILKHSLKAVQMSYTNLLK